MRWQTGVVVRLRRSCGTDLQVCRGSAASRVKLTSVEGQLATPWLELLREMQPAARRVCTDIDTG